VKIINWSKATRIDFDTVFDQIETAGVGNFGKHILGSVAGDIHKGVQTTEEMLTKGTTLTGIGELVSGPKGIFLQPPEDGRPYYLVKNSLSSLIKEVEANRSSFRMFMKIFIGIGMLISGAALWKLFKKMKIKESQDPIKPSAPIQMDLATEQTDIKIENSGPHSIQCVVCLDADRQVNHQLKYQRKFPLLLGDLARLWSCLYVYRLCR